MPDLDFINRRIPQVRKKPEENPTLHLTINIIDEK